MSSQPATAMPMVEPFIRQSQVVALSTDNFDPKKYIDFIPPSHIYKMSDLDLPEDTGVSPVAVSEPFQLFSHEAVLRMRAEVLSDEVWNNCQYSSNLARCQLRGFAAK